MGGSRPLVEDNFYGVVKMRGLPYSTTINEIKSFFSDIPVKEDGIFLCEVRLAGEMTLKSFALLYACIHMRGRAGYSCAKSLVTVNEVRNSSQPKCSNIGIGDQLRRSVRI